MMTTAFISSINLRNAPRTGLARMQSDLADATTEVATGRYADVGKTLGTEVGEAFSVRRESSVLAALTKSNATTAQRLDATQAALKEIQAGADATVNEITGLSADKRAAALATATTSRLAALTTALNTSAGGQYIFGGTNTGTVPLTDYNSSTTSTAKAAVATAFSDFFDFDIGSDDAADITATEMENFLDKKLAPMFEQSEWSGTWSSATNSNLTSQISRSETATTSINANAEPFRNLAMAYVIGSGLGLSSLSAAAQDVAIKRATDLLGSASTALVTAQSDLGRVQNRITDANTRMAAQTTALSTTIKNMESVDSAEAKSRIDALSTQISMSYSLTSQLRSLTLLNYLS